MPGHQCHVLWWALHLSEAISTLISMSACRVCTQKPSEKEIKLLERKVHELRSAYDKAVKQRSQGAAKLTRLKESLQVWWPLPPGMPLQPHHNRWVLPAKSIFPLIDTSYEKKHSSLVLSAAVVSGLLWNTAGIGK